MGRVEERQHLDGTTRHAMVESDLDNLEHKLRNYQQSATAAVDNMRAEIKEMREDFNRDMKETRQVMDQRLGRIYIAMVTAATGLVTSTLMLLLTGIAR